jgi:hypothetical protein
MVDRPLNATGCLEDNDAALAMAPVFTNGHPLEKHAKVCHFVPLFLWAGVGTDGEWSSWMSARHREICRDLHSFGRSLEAVGIGPLGSAIIPSP